MKRDGNRLGGAICAFILSMAPIVTAPAAAAAPRAPVTISAATYNSIIAQVATCDDFRVREPSLPRANPFLAKLARKEWPEKGEFETTLAYDQRIKAEIERVAVDPDLVLLEVDVSSKYDADKQVLTITVPVKFTRAGYGVTIASVSQSKKIDYGAHIYGSTAIATSTETYTVIVASDVFNDKELTVQMAVDQARLFKTYGRLVMLGSFKAPYISGDFDYWHSKRLFPNEERTYGTVFTFVPRCMTFAYTNKGESLPQTKPLRLSRSPSQPTQSLIQPVLYQQRRIPSADQALEAFAIPFAADPIADPAGFVLSCGIACTSW